MAGCVVVVCGEVRATCVGVRLEGRRLECGSTCAAQCSTTRLAIGVLRGPEQWRSCGRARVGRVGVCLGGGAGWLVGARVVLACACALACVWVGQWGAVGGAARGGAWEVVCCSVLAGLKVPAYSRQLVSCLLLCSAAVGDGACVRGWVPVRARVASV